ncbi:MAG: hypothetical protein ACFFD4_24115 [Candidatus Odinarchaeota archaeon]
MAYQFKTSYVLDIEGYCFDILPQLQARGFFAELPAHGLSTLDPRVLPASEKFQYLTTGAAKGPTSIYQPVLAGRRYVHHGGYLPSTVAVIQWTTVEIK